MSKHPYPENVVTPDQWCTSCGQYRAAEADGRYDGELCPVCADDRRREHHDVMITMPGITAAEAVQAINEMQAAMRTHTDDAGNRVIDTLHDLLALEGTVTEEHTDAEGNRVIDGLTLDSIELRPIRAAHSHWEWQAVGPAHECRCTIGHDHPSADAGVIDD